LKDIIYEEHNAKLSIERLIRNKEFSMTVKHMHPQYELYYLIAGERYYFIESETYHITSGNLVLIDRDEIHKTASSKDPYHERILVMISGECIHSIVTMLGLFSINQLIATRRIISFPSAIQPDILLLLEQIATELHFQRKGYETIINLKLGELLLLAFRCQNYPNPAATIKDISSPKHKKVDEIARFIREHYNDNLTLSSLSSLFFIQKEYLSRIFKEVTSVTLTEYIHIQRIKQAKEILENSNATITQVSEAVGYDSITYFEKSFKKYAGMSPLKYRITHCTG